MRAEWKVQGIFPQSFAEVVSQTDERQSNTVGQKHLLCFLFESRISNSDFPCGQTRFFQEVATA